MIMTMTRFRKATQHRRTQEDKKASLLIFQGALHIFIKTGDKLKKVCYNVINN